MMNQQHDSDAQHGDDECHSRESGDTRSRRTLKLVAVEVPARTNAAQICIHGFDNQWTIANAALSNQSTISGKRYRTSWWGSGQEQKQHRHRSKNRRAAHRIDKQGSPAAMHAAIQATGRITSRATGRL